MFEAPQAAKWERDVSERALSTAMNKSPSGLNSILLINTKAAASQHFKTGGFSPVSDEVQQHISRSLAVDGCSEVFRTYFRSPKCPNVSGRSVARFLMSTEQQLFVSRFRTISRI